MIPTLITRISMLTHIEHTLDVPCTAEQLLTYASGNALLQDAFPNVPAELREFIKTGITPDEWHQFISLSTLDADPDSDFEFLEEPTDDSTRQS